LTSTPSETPTYTSTPSETPTPSDTPTYTSTPSNTPTYTYPPTATSTPSATPTVTAIQNPALSVIKSVASTGPYALGDTIAFSILVTNTGNITLTNVTASDNSAILGSCAAASLAPNANIKCNATHVVTQADLNNGSYSNTATASSTQTLPVTSTATVIFGTSNNNISGTVFNDTNVNGIQDTGELGIPGVTVTLYDQSSSVVASTMTASDGSYSFINLPPGIYSVVETNLSGYVSTTLDHASVLLSSGTIAVVNFGDVLTGASVVDPAVTKFGNPSTAAVGDTVIFTITMGNNGSANALNVILTDTKPSFLDIHSINISPDHNFPVTISGNTFTIDFGTVTPSDFYTVTVVTVVNHLGTPPGGDNNVSITTSSSGDPLYNDQATAHITIPSNVLPQTGFTPGTHTSLAAEPDGYYDTGNDLTIEISSLGVSTTIVGVPEAAGAWDVSWLGDQAGYLEGTAFPTWSGNSVLTGHVYGADGLPGPFVNLKTLKWGDQVIIHFAGQQYIYEVRTNEVISPTDASIFSHKDYPWLTLLTCKDYNAQTNSYAHRVAVGAVLVQIEADPPAGSPSTPHQR
jgi:LPXTG-site transpeptidase (sortase) family protein